MNKISIYSLYLYDYLKHADFKSVVSSLKYIVNKSSHRKDRIIHTSIGTFTCRKNTNDFQFANYYYEWGVKKFILNQRNDFTTFLDVGACIGTYCILFAKLNKKCFAFEPIENNIKILNKNLELNHLENKVTVYPYGLGDADYLANYSFDPVNTGASRIKKANDSEIEKAKIRKLDTLMNEMGIEQNEPIFVKIDVEGMEVEAIQGAAKFIVYYPNITFIVEDKHSGQFSIMDTFNKIAQFEFGRVDKMNIYAKKIKNY